MTTAGLAQSYQRHRVDDLGPSPHVGRVTQWKDGSMKKRSIAAGIIRGREIARRIKGYRGISTLVAAFRRQVGPSAEATAV
jgi:hypothetical protein